MVMQPSCIAIGPTLAYCRLSRIFCHRFLGVCARSIVCRAVHIKNPRDLQAHCFQQEMLHESEAARC